MQMRTGGQSGRADVPDDLALLDPRPCPNVPGKSTQMSVTRRDSIQVSELDQIAVPTGSPGAQDHSIACRHDRCTGSGCIVGAFMPPRQSENWVKAEPGKVGGDPPELYRRAEERAAE